MNASTIILANGAFPKNEVLLNIMDRAEQLICCDGAVNKLIKSGRKPSIIIGDLDSVSTKYKNTYQDILIPIADQNTNDLTKAVDWCCANNIDEVIIMGATGEREDHTIGNIALLTEYHKKIKVKILTDNGVFIPISKTTTFSAEIGQQISVFSLDPNIEIVSSGLKYPLQKLALKTWWMGTLNEAIATEFEISFNENARIIVYLLNK